MSIEIQDILPKLIKDGTVTVTSDERVELLEQYLRDICESEHSSCSRGCPVYDTLGHVPISGDNCACFKSGSLMIEELKKAKVFTSFDELVDYVMRY
jgi:hypothetical protein